MANCPLTWDTRSRATLNPFPLCNLASLRRREMPARLPDTPPPAIGVLPIPPSPDDGAARLGHRRPQRWRSSLHYPSPPGRLRIACPSVQGRQSWYREYGAKTWAKVAFCLRILLSIRCGTFCVGGVVLGEWFRAENVPFVPSPTRPH